MTAPLALAEFAVGAVQQRDGFVRLRAGREQWIALAQGCAKGLQDFGALWRDGEDVAMMLYDGAARMRAVVRLALQDSAFPSVAQFHVPALRPERALCELQGLVALDSPDPRNWLDHGAWPQPAPRQRERASMGYAFLPVEGEGLHQIPVGPVHAGIIEPGHFRFTANGEAVVRLEERLGYVHKGVEALCAGSSLDAAGKVAARISGDSTVAYSFAYALAVEAALGLDVSDRARSLRGVMAELERVAHHVNDVGAICNDASVVAILAQCTILREDILQVCEACFGHRLMMDRIVPGGVACDLAPGAVEKILALLDRVSDGFERVVRVYDNMPSLLDRTVTTGRLAHDLARRFAAGGFVGRASGRVFDARSNFPYAPYDEFHVAAQTRTDGDVNARVWVRIEEARASIAFVREALHMLPDGPLRVAPPPVDKDGGEGAAMVEAFRGDVFIALRIDGEGCIAQFHARDASWFQWPLLEAAIEGNIVADFPLCNKSFNCSYSGHDL